MGSETDPSPLSEDRRKLHLDLFSSYSWAATSRGALTVGYARGAKGGGGGTSTPPPGTKIGDIVVYDQYFSKQWHLVGPNGINLAPGGTRSVWDDYSGKGIRIGIVDDGFQYTHKDLNDNYFNGWDARDRDGDAFASSRNDKHGTTVAGVIGAEMNNDGNYGVVGVAWNSDMYGFRMGFGSGIESQILDQMTRQVDMDVCNNSWGYNGFFFDDFNSQTFAAIGQAIEDAASLGRGGLGTVFVFAAGNDRASGQNVNYHDFQNSPYVITAAAINQDGTIASFSTPGAAVLVAAPGVGIVTTDGTGASGFVTGDFVSISGTSFAAPIISGVVALMLEANNRLGYRDVQEILAYSARNPDPDSPSWQTNGASNWNGGGLRTSTDFGFGLVDAHAAIRLAETWNQVCRYDNIASQTIALAAGIAILDNTGITTSTLQATSNILIDRVEVSLDISHSWIGQLEIWLTSPDGTSSMLVDRPGTTSTAPDGTSQDNIVFTMDSVQFWGENAVGDWTLSVHDTVSGQTGTLNSWGLTFIGDTDSANDTYIYTDSFGSPDLASDSWRDLLHDSGGIDTINLAAVTTDVLLDMSDDGLVHLSSVAGRDLVLDGLFENAFLGDGNDTVYGNSVSNIIAGGRGADDIWGGSGGDTFLYLRMGDAGDTIHDFSVAEGDVINLHDLFADIGYTAGTPWDTDYLSFLWSGNDTDLLIDADGGGSTFGFTTLTTLAGLHLTSADESVVSWSTVI